MMRFLRWLLSLLPWRRRPRPVSGTVPPARTIVTLLVYPSMEAGTELGTVTEVGEDRYYTSSPLEVDGEKLAESVRDAEDWLAGVLGTRIRWGEPVRVDSSRTVAEWRAGKIQLVEEVAAGLGMPWTEDYVYLAFVRGMGGYAGGIAYRDGGAGYSMVGDVCLEAVCGYPLPSAGSALLGDQSWPANSYSATGQMGAFIHEALHGLDLPHPDGWREPDRPGWEETLMGYWWNMPNFEGTSGLTRMEIDRVLRWTLPSP